MAIQQSMGQQYFQDTNLIMICMMGPRRGTGTGEGNKTPPPRGKGCDKPDLAGDGGKGGQIWEHLKKQTNTLGTFQMCLLGREEGGFCRIPTSICWPSVVVHPSLPVSRTISPTGRIMWPPLQTGLLIFKLCDEPMKRRTSFHRLAPPLKLPVL